MADMWDWLVPNISGQTNAKVADTRSKSVGGNGRLDPNAITRETLSGYGIPGDVVDEAAPYLGTHKMNADIAKSALTPPERGLGETIGGLLQAVAVPVSFAQGNSRFGSQLFDDNIMTRDAAKKSKYQDAERENTLKNAQGLMSNVDSVIAEQQKARAARRAENEARTNRENVSDRYGLKGNERTGYVLNNKFEPTTTGGTDDEKEYNTAVRQGFKGTLMDYFAAKKGQKIAPVKEYQTKDAMFSERLERAERNIDKVAGTDNEGKPLQGAYDPTPTMNKFVSDDSVLNSPEWRRYQQAAREGIAAILRKDTGAAVTESEWNLYFPMYYPQPGDDPATVQQKKESRAAVTKALRGSAGVAYEQMFGGKAKGGDGGPEVNDYSGMTDEEIKAEMGIE